MTLRVPLRSAALAALLLAATCLVVARPASAQKSDREVAAQVLFDEALGLMAKGKHAEACPKLEESQKLDPGMGTQFRLAECYESVGRLASAWSIFVDVADAAARAGAPERERVARERAETLRSRLPKLTIHVSPATAALPGLEVQRDAAPLAGALFGRAVPVDGGEHTVRAAAPGRVAWRGSVSVSEGTSAEITVPQLASLAAPVSPPAPDAATADRSTATPPESPGRLQRTGALVVGGIGVVGVVVGTIFGIQASSTWDEALEGCDDGAVDKCDESVQPRGDEALSQAHVSTVGFAVGGAGLVAAAILWFTAPTRTAPRASMERRLGVRSGPNGASAVLRF